MKTLTQRFLPRSSRPVLHRTLGAAAVALLGGALSAQAVTANFIGSVTGDNTYTNASNWDTGAVPNTANGDRAVIGDGSMVQYTPGGDLSFNNGGTLEVRNGSFTQVGGNNYIQLRGSGNVLVDGGTFNQGTDSANPFNVTNVAGSINTFTVSAGAANLNGNFPVNPGLSFTLSGGTVTTAATANVTDPEFDFNVPLTTISGGALTTGLITGNNGAGTTVLNMSGGLLNLTSARFNGYYAPSATHYVNFTLNSTAQVLFATSTGATLATVQGDVTAGGFEINNAVVPASSFVITQTANGITLNLPMANVPEPSTAALTALGGAALAGWARRRRRTA